MTIPADIAEIFFQTLEGEKTVSDFEQWLYAEKRLEKLLSSEDYLDLISYGYKRENSKDGLYKMLENWIEKGEYEKWRLYKRLRRALQRDHELPTILMDFYNLYCKGYSFLDNLGIGYGLAVAVPYPQANHWDELGLDQQQTVLKSFYPQLETEIYKVIGWLDASKIILTGQQNEHCRYEFIDHRTADEKKPTAYQRA